MNHTFKRISFILCLALSFATMAQAQSGLKGRIKKMYQEANAALKINDYQTAAAKVEEAINLDRQHFGTSKRDTALARSIIDLTTCYLTLGQYQKAIDWGEVMQTWKDTPYTQTWQYAKFLSNMGQCHELLGHYDVAKQLDTEALNLREKIYGKEHPAYASSLSDMANLTFAMGDYNKAIELETQAAEIMKNALGTENPEYGRTLVCLANFYGNTRQYEKAKELAQEAIDIFKKAYGTNSDDYAVTLGNLAAFTHYTGDTQHALTLAEEALQVKEKIFGKESPSYSATLNLLSGIYLKKGDLVQAVRLNTQVLKLREKIYGKNNSSYARALGNLAVLKKKAGDNEEAMQLESEVADILKNAVGTQHPDYAGALTSLADSYEQLGNYNKAKHLMNEAEDIYRNKNLLNDPNFFSAIMEQISLNYSIGDYENCKKYGEQVIELYNKNPKNSFTSYIEAYNYTARANSKLGNQQLAQEQIEKALQLVEEKGGKDKNYAIMLNNKASALHYIGEDEKALETSQEAKNLLKELGLEDGPYMLQFRKSEASILYSLKRYKDALNIVNDIHDDWMNTFKSSTTNKSQYFSSAALYNLSAKNYAEARQSMTKLLALQKKNVADMFSTMTQSERALYWNAYSRDFVTLAPQILYAQYDPAFAATIYDNTALFAKGLLLSTEKEVGKLIDESNDKEAVSMYKELRMNRLAAIKLRESRLKRDQLYADSLERLTDRQEFELVNKSATYGDFAKNLNITWKDVQAQLSDNDIAVEFINFPTLDNEKTVYAALTIKKGYEAPRMTVVCTSGDLKKHIKVIKNQNVYWPSSKFRKLIWGPLDKELKGVKNVYFSPSGLLCIAGIEYLPGKNDLHFCRLSSTRELAINHAATTSDKAALFGGIDYDSDIETMTAKSRQQRQDAMPNQLAQNEMSSSLALSSRAITEDVQLRSHVSLLAESKREIENASHSLTEKGMACTLYTGADATEESFKALDGKHVEILHVATHGLYFSPEEAAKRSDLSFIKTQDNTDIDRRVLQEETSMTHCGILFAGANNALDRLEIPMDVEDGILTAQEISQLDLRGLRMVVLSACDTGLGDVTASEGIFGLQRAFKKAGAQTVVMSLWRVDDKATQLLMTFFYENLAKGLSGHAALSAAQQSLRQVENGKYDDPSYWAAFIMMDSQD